ncbi:MAG: hypothetical protein AAGC60_26880 [Acidobacteriota bacterium]
MQQHSSTEYPQAETQSDVYYLVSFFTTLDGGATWQLNLSSVGTWTAGTGWNDPSVPSELAASFESLQNDGGTVVVSFGGGTFDPGTSITADSVDALAQAVAYSLLGGAEAPPASSPYAAWTPAFDDWCFDGLDLDLEASAGPPGIDPSVWVDFARALQTHAPGSKLTGAPQSPYLYNTNVSSPFGVPFPDGATQSCGEIPAPQDGDFLLSASNIGLFDALFVQFYNQGGSLDFPTEANFPTRVCQLVELITSTDAPTRFYVGVVAEGEGMNGEPPGVWDPQAIGDAIAQALAGAGGSSSSAWFGGVMGWESPKVTDFVSVILGVCGGDAALYGYQDGDPDW